MGTNYGPLRSYISGVLFGSVVFGLSYYMTSFAAHFINEGDSADNFKREFVTSVEHLGGHPNGSEHHQGVKTRLPEVDLTMQKCSQERSDMDPSLLAKLECKKRLPQIIGIGVEKCGTGAMAFFLNSHPYVIHSLPQEIYYWNKNKDKDINWYRDQMPLSSKYQITMEKTPSYIFDKDAPRMIKVAMPDTKFMVIIRDPIVRAVSDYLHLQTVLRPEFLSPRIVPPGEEPLCYLNTTFEGSVIRPNGEVNTDNAILVHSAYVLYLERWIKLFPREQFLIIDGDEFVKNPLPVLQEVERFLGLPKYFTEKIIYFDEKKGFFCKSKLRGKGTVCAGKTKGRKHPDVDEDVIRKLRSYFRPYNVQLEEMLDRRFSWS